MTLILRRSFIYKTQSNVFENCKLKIPAFMCLAEKTLNFEC